jgi:hypothetical protein
MGTTVVLIIYGTVMIYIYMCAYKLSIAESTNSL